jgi:hypothetical protein
MNPDAPLQGLGLQGKLLLVAVAVALGFVVVSMLRRRRLHEDYALVWLAMIAGMVVVVVSEQVLRLVTRLVGARYPASALTLISLAVIFVFLVLYSTRLSVLSDKVRDLAQEVALLRARLGEEEKQSPGSPAPGEVGDVRDQR